MKTLINFLIIATLASSCQRSADKEKAKDEIYQTEKAFEKMTSEKGVTEAFYFYADENAVIHRENDTLIGKRGYQKLLRKEKHRQRTSQLDTRFCFRIRMWNHGIHLWQIRVEI